MNWCFNIAVEFKKVRELIKKYEQTIAHCIKIMSVLENCCDVLTPNNMAGWDYYDKFIELKSGINTEIEYMKGDNNYLDCEESVNYYLNEFYNLCDEARVWLGV